MPFTAKIKRDDPFCSGDQREIDAMCRRIAGAAEHCALAGWREESGYRVYHFTTWAKARAMQHWIDRSGIAHRPMPKLRPRRRRKQPNGSEQALAWGLATGAVREIVQAYRRARHAGGEDLTAFNAACTVGLALGRPNDEVQHTVEVLLEWARENHREWFYRFEPAAAPAPESDSPCPRRRAAGPGYRADSPRHSPIF